MLEVKHYVPILGTDTAAEKSPQEGMDDNMFKPNEWVEKGELSGDAAKIIMKILYGARFYRWDLIRDINY